MNDSFFIRGRGFWTKENDRSKPREARRRRDFFFTNFIQVKITNINQLPQHSNPRWNPALDSWPGFCPRVSPTTIHFFCLPQAAVACCAGCECLSAMSLLDTELLDSLAGCPTCWVDNWTSAVRSCSGSATSWSSWAPGVDLPVFNVVTGGIRPAWVKGGRF